MSSSVGSKPNTSGCSGLYPVAPPGYPTPTPPALGSFSLAPDNVLVTNNTPFALSVTWARKWPWKADQADLQQFISQKGNAIGSSIYTAASIGIPLYLLAFTSVTFAPAAVLFVALAAAYFTAYEILSVTQEESFAGDPQNVMVNSPSQTLWAKTSSVQNDPSGIIMTSTPNLYCQVQLQLFGATTAQKPAYQAAFILIDSTKGYLDDWFIVSFVSSDKTSDNQNVLVHVLSSYNMPNFASDTGELFESTELSVHFAIQYLGATACTKC
jgi:hypothetical protein